MKDVLDELAAARRAMGKGSLPAGDAYTYAEYERMLRATGFARSALHELPIPNQRVVVGYK